MSSKSFANLSGVIFLIVAVLHLARLVFKWSVSIGGWTVPMWLSVAAVVIAGYLSYAGFRICHHS